VFFTFCSCFVVLSIFIFVCTCVGLLPPGESPIAVKIIVIIIIIIIICNSITINHCPIVCENRSVASLPDWV
jgi:hypothetical protein